MPSPLVIRGFSLHRLISLMLIASAQGFMTHHNCLWPHLHLQKSTLQQSTSSTKRNLLWFGNDEKKAKNDQKDTKQQSKSKMGTTATTMENFKQSQELGKKTSSLLNDLLATSVEGSAGKGKIKVIVDGQQRPKLVEIDEDYFAQVGVEDFTEALAIAMQDAHDRSTKIMEDKMASLYIELGLPSPKQ
eukprot:scaffold10552_cov276-Chaetoceros_neogracile.AAC.43